MVRSWAFKHGAHLATPRLPRRRGQDGMQECEQVCTAPSVDEAKTERVGGYLCPTTQTTYLFSCTSSGPGTKGIHFRTAVAKKSDVFKEMKDGFHNSNPTPNPQTDPPLSCFHKTFNPFCYLAYVKSRVGCLYRVRGLLKVYVPSCHPEVPPVLLLSFTPQNPSLDISIKQKKRGGDAASSSSSVFYAPIAGG